MSTTQSAREQRMLLACSLAAILLPFGGVALNIMAKRRSASRWVYLPLSVSVLSTLVFSLCVIVAGGLFFVVAEYGRHGVY